MKYRIVQLTDHGWDNGESTDIEAWMEARGHKVTGYHTSPNTRKELQNQPTFKEFAGPMWDGDAVRYEDWQAYNIMSI